MTYFSSNFSAALAVIATLSSQSIADGSPPQKELAARHVSIEVPSKCAVTAAMPLKILIRNVDDVPLVVWANGYCPRCVTKLVDLNDGRTIPLTNVGTNMTGGLSRMGGSGSHVSLKKNEMRSWTIDLRDCYNLTAGRYEISVVVQLPSPGLRETESWVSTKAVAFEVSE